MKHKYQNENIPVGTVVITILRIMYSLGPQSFTALTKRNENKYQASRSKANTILF
jgi:hypothetical protein